MANANDRARVYAEVTAERNAQDAQWGGEAHDDGHGPSDWLEFIDHQRVMASRQGSADAAEHYGRIRARLVKIAALAVAGIESIDRCLDA